VKAAALVGPPEVAVEKVAHSSVPLPYCTPPPTPGILRGSGLFCWDTGLSIAAKYQIQRTYG
jgi:hypothetical protein